MASTLFNGQHFNHATNIKRTEKEFVDRWSPLVWHHLRPDERVDLLKEAYQLILKDAGVIQEKPSKKKSGGK